MQKLLFLFHWRCGRGPFGINRLLLFCWLSKENIPGIHLVTVTVGLDTAKALPSYRQMHYRVRIEQIFCTDPTYPYFAIFSTHNHAEIQ